MANQGLIDNINWLYTTAGNSAPASIGAWFYPVKIGSPVFNAVRGPIGATDCLFIATLYAFSQDYESSLSWMCAAQGHKPEIVNDFKNNQDFVFKYVVEHYLPAAAARYGQVIAAFTKEKATEVVKNVGDQIVHRPGGVRPPFPTPDDDGGPRGGGAGHDHKALSNDMIYAIDKITELYERLLNGGKAKS